MAPGKTAPRLLQDLFTYDPRHEERAGRNLLTSPPPQHDANAAAVAAVPFRNCRHNFFIKDKQSIPVEPEREPDTDTVYKVAAYCQKCRWHVDVVADHRNNDGKSKWCGRGNTDYALHHFLYQGQEGSNGINGLEAQLPSRTYSFRCSAPQCSLHVRIGMRPPVFSEHDIETLTNQAKLRKRWEVAQHLAGDRADPVMARRVDAPDYLNTYLQDSLNPSKGKARIPLFNKKFLKTFGRDCDSILRRLGFENRQEEDEEGTLIEAWYLPRPENTAHPLEYTLRTKIEDARYELNTIILSVPENERANCRHQPMHPLSSRDELERVLACADYAKAKGRETRSTSHEEDHPYYASLGALADFDDSLILFAFSRQVAVDIDNKDYYFECLQDLAAGRQSETLGVQVALLASQGLISKRDAQRAYQYFGINPAHASVIGDEHIIGSFKSRLSDISPLQAEEARKQLRVLGDVRDSERIRAEAAGSIETYDQAMSWFDLDPTTADDFVQTMYSLKTQDNPAEVETAQKALQIIADHRQSERLQHFLKFGTMSEPEMDLGDAYAHFQVSDRSVALDPAVLDSLLSTYELGTSERARMEKAHALIQQDQTQRFGNRPANAPMTVVRRNNYPLESWPVGLRNIGNTCYLNSVLQFLFTIKPLRDLILNCEDHLQDPSPEALKDKKVGRMAVTPERVLTAQKFVRELRAFFERMIKAPTDTVQPEIDLASLALCKSDISEEAEIQDSDVVPGVGLGTIDGAVVSGPMLPPAEDQLIPVELPAGSIINKNEIDSTDTVMDNTDTSAINPTDSEMKEDAPSHENGSTKEGGNDVPAPPTRPPPVPPGLSIKLITLPAEPIRATLLKRYPHLPRHPGTMGKKRVLISYGIDVDAVCGWLGSYGGQDSTSDISRGLFAGTVGTQRLLKLFKKYDIKTTWFIPGHSLETFPEDMAAVRDAGHEIGLHGYSHENPVDMSLEQQRDVLDKTYRMLTEFAGKPPRGSVAPWWETSREGAELLLSYGIEYDHSMSHHDCQPYYLRTGDSWTKIDYKKKAQDWMKPLVAGQDTGLVEIPANWYLDDLPPHMFIKGSPNSHGFVNARDTEDLWRDHFDYFYREYDEFIFPLTIHPDVSGRPHLLLMHERLIEHFKKHEGVEFVTMEQMADEFKKKNAPAEGALLPAPVGAKLKE